MNCRLPLIGQLYALQQAQDGQAGCESRGLGLPHIRQHDMRHLHASVLLAEGLPLPVVAARLGHVSPAVTAAIYSRALRGHDGAAATAIEAAMRVAR